MHDIERHRTTPFSVHADEASFLFGLTKMVSPRIIVEFGTLSGLTSANFLNAMDEDALLYSYDLRKRKEIDWIVDSRFRFLKKNQTSFEPKDVEFRPVDLVYLDASHKFRLNVETFEAIRDSLSPKALLVTHDTSIWARQPDEIRFADWLGERTTRIDFHCDRKKRWGLTVFQMPQRRTFL